MPAFFTPPLRFRVFVGLAGGQLASFDKATGQQIEILLVHCEPAGLAVNEDAICVVDPKGDR
jgi:hypothetical protein